MPAALRRRTIIKPKFPRMLFGLPWKFVDTAQKLVVKGGALFGGPQTVGFVEPRIEDIQARVRVPGRMLSLVLTPSNTNNYPAVGWGSPTSVLPDSMGVATLSNALYLYDGIQLGPFESTSNATAYTVYIIQGNHGALIIIQGGSQFASPTLLWV